MAKSNIREFWKYVNTKRKNTSIPEAMYLNQNNANDTTSIANLLSVNFKSIYKQAANEIPAYSIESTNTATNKSNLKSTITSNIYQQ